MIDTALLSTKRFSDRVSDYAKYRPSYPDAVVDWLIDTYALNDKSSIADIGSGTGIFSRLLLEKGLSVIAVEPNDDMRAESDRVLGKSQLYQSVSGTAENTTLADGSVNFVVAAQAFHWFDVSATKAEFYRIIRPGGVLALIWNRRLTSTEFQSDYEMLLSGLAGYGEVKHTRLTNDDIGHFIGDACEKKEFPYSQKFDYESFQGRVFSSSYTPRPTDDAYAEFVEALQALFDKYSEGGTVSFEYNTTVFSGCLK